MLRSWHYATTAITWSAKSLRQTLVVPASPPVRCAGRPYWDGVQVIGGARAKPDTLGIRIIATHAEMLRQTSPPLRRPLQPLPQLRVHYGGARQRRRPLAGRPESAIIFAQDLGSGVVQDHVGLSVRPLVGRMEWPPRAWVLGTKNP